MQARAPADASLDDVEEFAAAASAFTRLLSSADLRAPVPTCPGWRVYDLAVHLGNEHGWAATVVETGRRAAEQHDEPASRRRGRSVAQWYAGKAEDLHAVLEVADPAASCWSFATGTGTVRFWSRRQWHETTMHTVDLAAAAKVAHPLAAHASADGVDEALRVFLPWMAARDRPPDLTAPLTLTATDLPRSWGLRPGSPAPRVVDGPVEASNRVEATSDVLFRLLWGRLPVDDPGVRYVGDTDPARRFLTGPLTP